MEAPGLKVVLFEFAVIFITILSCVEFSVKSTTASPDSDRLSTLIRAFGCNNSVFFKVPVLMYIFATVIGPSTFTV